MKTKSLLLFVGAFTLAVGASLVARNLLRPAPPITIVKEVEAPREPVRFVLGAAQALKPGDFLSGASLVWLELPESRVGASQFSASTLAERQSIERAALGSTLRRPIGPNEPLLRDVLVQAGEPGFVAAVLTPGMRAMSIPTTAVASNAGLVSAGDWVDVILSLDRSTLQVDANDPAISPLTQLASQTILKRVRVLALNNNAASIAPAPSADPAASAAGAGSRRVADAQQRMAFESLTLEVSPAAAEQLAVAREVGTLQVVLRSVRTEDPDPAETRRVTRLLDITDVIQPRTSAGKTGSVPIVVKTYQGVQQGALTFDAR